MTGNNPTNERSQREHPVKDTSSKLRVQLPKHKPCDHRNLVPYIMRAERMTFQGQNQIIDRCPSIINGQWLRVTKYYCPNCNQFIEPPKE